MDRILNDLRILGNLKAANYASTKQERDEVISAVRNALNNVEEHFAGDHKKEVKEFHFISDMPNGIDDEPIIDLRHDT